MDRTTTTTTEVPETAAQTLPLIFRVKGHDDGNGGRCKPVAHRATAWTGRNEHGLATSRDDLQAHCVGNWSDWRGRLSCPTCERAWWVYSTPLRGKTNPRHRCDARCTGATGVDCECSCGGEQHGIDHC